MMTKEKARAEITALINKYQQLKNDKAQFGRTSEEDVVNHFITPLLRTLGWPTDSPQLFKYELHTQVGRPDIRVEYGPKQFIYVEAKRFGIIEPLIRNTLDSVLTPRQMQQPGMATDRTKEEQQAINYAFENDGTWAILTNFERFRLFNARRDWLVFSIESPDGYLDSDFDYLWQLAWHNIQSGSLDVLSNQRARADVDTDYLNFINEWRLKLAQDILVNRAKNWWAFDEKGVIDLPRLRAVVQRILDRLVVVRYAEDHLLIKSGTLLEMMTYMRGQRYRRRTFNDELNEFYSIFNDQHNSALFAPNDADHADISDKTMFGLVEKLYGARFRAMTPDIMGNTYEQYLGKTLAWVGDQIETRDNVETRKKQGSYYTPQVIVRYIVDNSLGRYLYGTADGQSNGALLPDQARKTFDQIESLRLIDPACGSGSFLIYAYEVLANFYRSEIDRVEKERDARLEALIAQGVTAPFELRINLAHYEVALNKLQGYPHLILERHLYGVDLDPQAAEIATVNLIMRGITDLRDKGKALPSILNQNIKVGNGLIGLRGEEELLRDHAESLATLRLLRLKVVNQKEDHDQLNQEIGRLTQQIDALLNEQFAAYFAELPAWQTAIRPFHWPVHFPELFVDENGHYLGTQAGFTIIVGNPPWEIIKPDMREYYAQFDANLESKLTRQKAEARIAELDRFDPTIALGWQEQWKRITAMATYTIKSKAYTRQGKGDTATHKLFVEQAYTLLQAEGRLGLLIPSGIYSDLGTKELRELLLNEGSIERLISLTNGARGGDCYFPDVHRSFKITVLLAKRGVISPKFLAMFRIDPRDVPKPSEFESLASNPTNFIEMHREKVMRFSPTSLSIMEFKSEIDYELASQIYGNWPALGEETDHWNIKLMSELHMTNDRHLFNQDKNGLPLYEGKMIHQFDAFFSTPNYWVVEKAGRAAVLGKNEDTGQLLNYQQYRLAFRDIARSTDARTMIATMLPCGVYCNNKIPYVQILGVDPYLYSLFVLGVLNSFVIDFIIRLKVSSTLNFFYVYQLPMPRLVAGDRFFDEIVVRAAKLVCTRPEFAALWEAVMGSAWSSGVCAADSAERQQLRDELDGMVAVLFGLTREQYSHLLKAFPLVFGDSAEGLARLSAVLRAYDQSAEAFRSL